MDKKYGRRNGRIRERRRHERDKSVGDYDTKEIIPTELQWASRIATTKHFVLEMSACRTNHVSLTVCPHNSTR